MTAIYAANVERSLARYADLAMLYDKTTIHVEAGGGGKGCMSFRREAHVPKGGPDGGDGGRGGDVVLIADAGLRDLASFRQRRHHRAGRGVHGQGSQREGAEGEALELRVPCGTVVENLESGTRWDLTADGARATVATGGQGGRGNRRFATSTRQAPRFAELGLAGEQATIELRLKLLADVGLVGQPNAGKSSLLSALTRARPKVADYPFTTLEPVLGTIEDDEGRQLVLADIPGLIEGASEGAGLGDEFLAHVERTKLLVHVLDVAPIDGSSPAEAFEAVRAELAAYGAGLETRPYLIALSKMDLVTEEERDRLVAEWSGRAAVVATSSVAGTGLTELARTVFAQIPAEPASEHSDEVRADQLAEHAVYRPVAKAAFAVEPSGERVFRISGPSIERLIARHDLENEDALAYIEERLRSIGVVSALESKGFEPGDEIVIGEVAFALYPDVPQNG
ncbi:MAG: GTPase ObgE [Solirubrobacterales bacterium]